MDKLQLVSFLLTLGLSLGISQNIKDFEYEETNGRIINGFTAKPGQFPYQASIKLMGVHHCGGSIISPIWILTAAHCLAGCLIETLAVVVGDISVQGNNGQAFRLSQMIVHERFAYPNKLSNDIGLIRVAGQISYNNVVKPIQLTSQPPQLNLQYVISGWGTTVGGGSVPPPLLQFIDAALLSKQQCNAFFPSYASDNGVMCAQNAQDRRVCTGDSGGPLVSNGMQYGIVSFVASELCPSGTPGAYANVYFYRQWITRFTGV